MEQKISILLPNLHGGGAERVCLTLAYEFKKAGHDVSFIVYEAVGELLEEAQAEFRIVSLGTKKLRKGLWPLRRILRSEKPDLLIANMWPVTSIAAIAAIGTGVEVETVEHGVLSEQYGKAGLFHRAALRASLAISLRKSKPVGVSTGVAQDVARLGFCRSDRVCTIHNPVPKPVAGPTLLRDMVELLWNEHQGVRLLTVGSLKQVKRQERMIEALAALPKAMFAKLMIVGAGNCQQLLEEKASALGVRDRVLFAGFQTELAAFYEAADLFLLTSEREGFANVLVEAMACGTPVLSTDCPFGPAEVLEDGKFGELVPLGDKNALCRAIENALAKPRNPNRLMQRANDFAPLKAAQAYLRLAQISPLQTM